MIIKEELYKIRKKIIEALRQEDEFINMPVYAAGVPIGLKDAQYFDCTTASLETKDGNYKLNLNVSLNMQFGGKEGVETQELEYMQKIGSILSSFSDYDLTVIPKGNIDTISILFEMKQKEWMKSDA